MRQRSPAIAFICAVLWHELQNRQKAVMSLKAAHRSALLVTSYNRWFHFALYLLPGLKASLRWRGGALIGQQPV